MTDTSIITASDIVTAFGSNLVHDGVNLSINQGEIYALIGGSGSGKSTLLKEMIMLQEPQAGSITVLGHDLATITPHQASSLRQNWGVLFQGGALYTSLNVAENVAIKLHEYTDLPKRIIDDIVQMKINMVGLPARAAQLYPAQLSGGMIKRAALARALAMDPQLLFLDEPTSGLDPVGAADFDALISELRDLLNLTVVIVTHDLDSIWSIVNRLAMLGEKRVVAEGNINDILNNPHPVVSQFFGGNRGQLRRNNGK